MATAGTGYLDIADSLERSILSGQLRTNHKLPSTTQMAKDWSVSPLTIQRSLRRLADKGMVKRVPGRGTVVIATIRSDTLGLLFGANVDSLPSHYYLSLLSAFQNLSGEYGLQTQEYLVFDEKATFRSLSALEEDAREGKLRCFIPVYFSDQVGKWLDSSNNLPFVTLPGLDLATSFNGLVHLIERGYKNIVFMSIISQNNNTDYEKSIRRYELESIDKACKKTGFDRSGIEYIESVADEAEGFEIASGLLKNKKYDAFWVRHDIVLRGVVMALLKSGRKIGKDVGIMGTLNKGTDIFIPFGLSHFVNDPVEPVRACLEYITNAQTILKPGLNNCPGNTESMFIASESTMRK